MNTRIPDLPPSTAATLLVLGSLALVLGHAGSAVAGGQLALKSSAEVRSKLRRLFSELERAQAERNETLSWLSTSGRPLSPAAVAAQVEETGQRLDRMRDALRRVEQGADLLEQALRDSDPHARTLKRMYPGWPEAVAKSHETLAQLRSELRRFDFERQAAESNQGPLREMLLRALAEQGLDEWAEGLPPEDGPMFDDADARPIHWDESRGWVEGPR